MYFYVTDYTNKIYPQFDSVITASSPTRVPPHCLFDFLALKAALFFLLILARLLSRCVTPLPDDLGCLHRHKQNLCTLPYQDVRCAER